MAILDITKLKETVIQYDRTLRQLPVVQFRGVSQLLHINVMDLQGKHSLILERRRAGGTQPYTTGKTFTALEKLLGYEPSVIEPKDMVFITKGNSQDYDDDRVILLQGTAVSNITKRHPLELRVAMSMVSSFGEDLVYNMFHASRDTAGTTPDKAFDGFFTKIAALQTAGELTATRGNLATTGAISAPTGDTDTKAYDTLVEFVAEAHPLLRSSVGGRPQLLASQGVLKAARAAYRNKVKSFQYPSLQQMVDALREDAFCPQLQVVSHEALGTGSKLVLQKEGNFDFAFNTRAASRYIEIRNIYEDPNEWQFWLQSGADTRVRDWHEKVFRTNEQSNTALDLSGDYAKETATASDTE